MIIGNPPYVLYSKVKHQYQLKSFITESSQNLFAYTLERSLHLLGSNGEIGMIVPMSLVSTQNMTETSNLLIKNLSRSHFSHYSGNRNPSVLFEGVEMRLTIVLGQTGNSKTLSPAKLTTEFFRWNTEARENLFPCISYIDFSEQDILQGLIPKLSGKSGQSVLEKLHSQRKSIRDYVSKNGRNEIYAHRIASYFVKCFDFIPYFFNERDGIRKSEDYKILSLESHEESVILCALINSGLFYFFYIAYSDAYHCGRDLCSRFSY